MQAVSDRSFAAEEDGWREARFLGRRRRPLPMRPYRISLDAGGALKSSAILWLSVAAFISTGAAIAGLMSSWIDYLVVVLGVVCSIIIAGVLYVTFWIVNGRPWILAWSVLIIAIALCAALQTGADYGTQYLDHALTPGPGAPDLSAWNAFQLGFVYISLYAANAALMQVAFSSRQLREQDVALARQETAAAQAELRILRMQLNPHFMFNALSAVTGLQLAGRHRDAAEVTEKLIDFMRAAVDVDAGKDIRVAEEMAILDSYLGVEMARFGDRLRLEVDVAREIEDALVPNLLLQPLVENAMKYAVEPSVSPVTVSIQARPVGDCIRFEVVDRGKSVTGEVRPMPGLGVGLAATRDRLRLAYGRRATLSASPRPDGYAVTVEVPWVRGG